MRPLDPRLRPRTRAVKDAPVDNRTFAPTAASATRGARWNTRTMAPCPVPRTPTCEFCPESLSFRVAAAPEARRSRTSIRAQLHWAPLLWMIVVDNRAYPLLLDSAGSPHVVHECVTVPRFITGVVGWGSSCGYWMVHPPSAMYTAPWRSPPPRGHRVSGSEKEYARSSGSISLRTEGEVSVAISAAAVTSLARVPVTASRCRGNRRPSCGRSPRSDRGCSRSARVVIRRIRRFVRRCATGCFVSRTGRCIGT